jgi:hypothetical protein
MTKGKAKSFANRLEERLDAREIEWLENAAKLEVEFFTALKKDLSEAVKNYLVENGLNFAQMAKRVCCTDVKLARILNGGHGFTMATIAHIGAAMRLRPQITFTKEGADTGPADKPPKMLNLT